MRDVQQEIKQQIQNNDILLYMKGDRDNPNCGFSAAVVSILNNAGVSYSTVDVLADEEIRQGIKQFSDWPTIPQLYVKGEFLGGGDNLKEMVADGELQSLLTSNGLLPV